MARRSTQVAHTAPVVRDAHEQHEADPAEAEHGRVEHPERDPGPGRRPADSQRRTRDGAPVGAQPGRHVTALATPTRKALITVVVPFLNARRYFEITAPSLVRAAQQHGAVELVFVDNGSTDGSAEFLEGLAPELIQVLQRPGLTIAALRNEGARAGSGDYLAFLDADCAIPSTYFERAVDVLRTSGASATGCEVDLPDRPHWVERTLHDLHFMGRDRDVLYINSANFFIARDAFESVGGFCEELQTGEDSDIGPRLIVAGYRIRECPQVQAIHHGNPKSLREYYRRAVWHGLGMFATVTRHHLDKPTVMLFAQLFLTLVGIALIVAGPGPFLVRTVVALLMQGIVPAMTVLFRMGQTRRSVHLGRALYLYWLYYWARAHALLLIATGRAHQFTK